MAQELTTRKLFGGAMTMAVPAAMTDISDIRQVPDNQEVFTSSDNNAVIIEILEYQDNVPDEKAAKFFFDELADTNECSDAALENVGTQVCGSLPSSVAQLAAGHQSIKKFKSQDADKVNVELAVIRLPSIKTDIVLSMNKPEEEPRSKTFSQVLDSVAILDWSLFGET